MTSSNGNIFRVTGPLCGEFTGPGEFPAQRPVTRSFDVFFDLRLNKRLSKQLWGWRFETPSWSLWLQCNGKHFIEATTKLLFVIWIIPAALPLHISYFMNYLCRELDGSGNNLVHTHIGTFCPDQQIQVDEYAPNPVGWTTCFLLMTSGSVQILTRIVQFYIICISSHWRHNERHGVSNHQPHKCFLNLLFRRRSKKTSKLRVTGLCAGNSPVTGEFPAQMASNAENVSIW